MTPGGWIFMTTSLVFVLSLVSWCYYKVLTTPTHPVEPEGAG